MVIRRAKRAGLTTLVVLSLAGCAHPPRLGGDPALQVLPSQSLPAPGRTDFADDAQPFYVGPNDRLIIDVFGIDELSRREVLVDASGRLSFPLAGVLDARGMTPAEIESALAERLRAAHIRNPQVSVNLKESLSRVVTVEGQVRRPGIYPLVGRMTLLRAVARAEGTDEFSKLDEVVVFRTVAGQRYAALYNLDAIRHGAYADPEIYADDLVMVGDDRSKRMFRNLTTITSALLSPIVLLLQSNP